MFPHLNINYHLINVVPAPVLGPQSGITALDKGESKEQRDDEQSCPNHDNVEPGAGQLGRARRHEPSQPGPGLDPDRLGGYLAEGWRVQDS